MFKLRVGGAGVRARGGRGRWGDGPPRLGFWLGYIAVLALMPVFAAALVGCKAGPVRERAQQVESQAEKLAEASDAIGMKIEEATSGQLSPDQLAAAVGPLLPDEYRPGFEEAMQKTNDAVAVALEVNRAVANAARETAAEARRLRERYADAKADDDATLGVIESIVTVGLSLLLGGGAAGGLVAKIFKGRMSTAVSTAMQIGQRDGAVEGARAVAKLISVGRELDPKLDEAFRTLDAAAKLEMHRKLEDAEVLEVVESQKLGPSAAVKV